MVIIESKSPSIAFTGRPVITTKTRKFVRYFSSKNNNIIKINLKQASSVEANNIKPVFPMGVQKAFAYFSNIFIISGLLDIFILSPINLIVTAQTLKKQDMPQAEKRAIFTTRVINMLFSSFYWLTMLFVNLKLKSVFKTNSMKLFANTEFSEKASEGIINVVTLCCGAIINEILSPILSNIVLAKMLKYFRDIGGLNKSFLSKIFKLFTYKEQEEKQA